MAMAGSPRHDLGTLYAKIMVEVAAFANEGAKLLIKNEWMEQPPLVPDREAISKYSLQ
jgi:hypothetical protein